MLIEVLEHFFIFNIFTDEYHNSFLSTMQNYRILFCWCGCTFFFCVNHTVVSIISHLMSTNDRKKKYAILITKVNGLLTKLFAIVQIAAGLRKWSKMCISRAEKLSCVLSVDILAKGKLRRRVNSQYTNLNFSFGLIFSVLLNLVKSLKLSYLFARSCFLPTTG